MSGGCRSGQRAAGESVGVATAGHPGRDEAGRTVRSPAGTEQFTWTTTDRATAEPPAPEETPR